MKPFICCLISLAAFQASGGAFMNLNFELVFAQSLTPVAGDPYQRVDAAEGLRGWHSSTGERLENLISINNQFLDSAGVSLFTKRVSGPLDYSSQIIQGSSSAFLQSGVQLFGGPNVGASIAQTGIVPAGSQSLVFLTSESPSPFSVSLNGSPATVIDLGRTDPGTLPAYNTYGVNLAALAGQDVELRFTVLPGANNSHGFLVLDDLRFSSTSVVPEPGTWALFGVGSLALAWSFRRQPTTGKPSSKFKAQSSK